MFFDDPSGNFNFVFVETLEDKRSEPPGEVLPPPCMIKNRLTKLIQKAKTQFFP